GGAEGQRVWGLYIRAGRFGAGAPEQKGGGPGQHEAARRERQPEAQQQRGVEHGGEHRDSHHHDDARRQYAARQRAIGRRGFPAQLGQRQRGGGGGGDAADNGRHEDAEVTAEHAHGDITAEGDAGDHDGQQPDLRGVDGAPRVYRAVGQYGQQQEGHGEQNQHRPHFLPPQGGDPAVERIAQR